MRMGLQSSRLERAIYLGTLLSAILIAGVINAAPKTEKKIYSVNASASAPVGGSIVRNLGAEPPTINPVSYIDVSAQILLTEYLCDGLLINDPNSYELVPRLAEKFETSKDGKVYTFHIRKNAVFHDGTPVTAEDVKFSFDIIKEPEMNAADKIPYLDGIEKIEVLDEKTVRFTVKNTYFQNLTTIGTTFVIPKKVYGDIKKAKTMNKEIVCSGPYALEKYERGTKIVVKRFEKWYGFSVPEMKGEANFDSITFRFLKEPQVEMEALKKGDIDIAEWPIPLDVWMKLAEGPMFGKTVFKVEAKNTGVRSFGFYGMNFNNPIFKDKSVRLALYHLMNREEMNKKFRFGKSDLATGPFNLSSEYADPNVKPVLFDPAKAKELLTKAGWTDADKDGVLTKTVDGKKLKLRFTLSYAYKEAEKYHTIFKEDLKKAGVDMDLKLMEWNSFTKMLDEKNFDMIGMSWGGVIDWDPKQIWHSESIGNGGSNFISYRNPTVDKLIDEARLITDRKKRIAKMRAVYKLIAEDVPYLFWFNNKYDYYIRSGKVATPGESFEKEIGFRFWWKASPSMN